MFDQTEILWTVDLEPLTEIVSLDGIPVKCIKQSGCYWFRLDAPITLGSIIEDHFKLKVIKIEDHLFGKRVLAVT